MIYKYNELLKIYKNRYQITKAIENNELYKIDSAVYTDTKYFNEMEFIQRKYSNSIYTMDTAFYLHELTDVIPRKYQLAVHNKNRKIDNPKVETYFIQENFFSVGKKQLEIDKGIVVTVYDKERMLIELIRNKNQIPYDYYKEILNNYREIVGELEIRKIQEYLTYFKNGENIFKIIRNEVY